MCPLNETWATRDLLIAMRDRAAPRSPTAPLVLINTLTGQSV